MAEQGTSPSAGPTESKLSIQVKPNVDLDAQSETVFEEQHGQSALEQPDSPQLDTELSQSRHLVSENDKLQEEPPLQTPVSEQNGSTPPPPPTSSSLLESERLGLERKISSEGVRNVEEEVVVEKPPAQEATSSNPGTGRQPSQSTTDPEPSTSSSTTKRRRPKSAISSSSLGIVDDNTPVRGEVLDFHSSEIVTRRLTFPSKLIFNKPHIPYQDGWAFQKVFQEEDLMASGFLFLDVNGRKPIKHTKNNTYMMLVLEGAVAVEIHRTTYVLCPGSSFHLPRGNTYSLANISNREAKLFFVQAVQSPPTSSARNDSLLTTLNTHLHSSLNLNIFRKPTTKASMLFHWLAPRIISRYLELKEAYVEIRKGAGVWYERNLKKYEKYSKGGRAYWLCFFLGLMVRRLPFIGSPPILNIQFVSARAGVPVPVRQVGRLYEGGRRA